MRHGVCDREFCTKIQKNVSWRRIVDKRFGRRVKNRRKRKEDDGKVVEKYGGSLIRLVGRVYAYFMGRVCAATALFSLSLIVSLTMRAGDCVAFVLPTYVRSLG